MTVVSMSQQELSRFDTVLRVERRELRPKDAAALLGISRRQVFRLLGRLRSNGAEGLISRKRGKPSNRRLSDAVRQHAIALVQAHYADFGPTLAAEYLAERHDVRISHESLRKLMIDAGLWKDRQARRPRPYQPRYRRDCRGELVQIDGSKHWWLEEHGPQASLLVFIDDATSELMHLKMVETENTFSYMEATREYIEMHGKPVAFYSDKHGVFRVNRNNSLIFKDAAGGDGMTQFGRALHQLNIDIICANAPQAKGRVERANGTLQDRLVKEMRLAGISTIEAGNEFLPGFMEDYNRRFAKEPRSDKDLHRPLSEHDQLDEAFAWKEDRTVSNSLTLQYDHVLFILEPNAVTRPLARQRVTVFDYPDGRLAIKHKGLELPYRTFDKRQRVNQAAVVENKRLGPVLAYIAERQKERDLGRSKKAPRRRGQGPSLFKVG